MGSYSVSDIQNEMKKLEKTGTLIRHENQFTTKELLNKEKKILEYGRLSIGTSKQLVVTKKIDKYLSEYNNRQIAINNDFKS